MRKELSKLTPQIVFIVFSIAFFYCRGVNAATYYVDSSVTDTNVASATPDFTTYNHATFETTGGMDSVFKTIADINAFAALQPGDSVLFRRNQTWAEVLTIPASGTAGNPITFGAYGSSGHAKIQNSTTASAVSSNSKSYIIFENIFFSNTSTASSVIALSNGDEITINNCIIKDAAGRGVRAYGTSNIHINNSLIINNGQHGLHQSTGTVTLRNTMIIGNANTNITGANYGIYKESGGTLDYDYNLISGNHVRVDRNISTAGTATDGGHNVLEQSPELTAYPNNTAYFMLAIDDHDIVYMKDACEAVNPLGGKMTLNVVPSNVTELEKTDIAEMASAGNEIGVHSYSHTYLNSTNAFQITSTNTNPTVDVDAAGDEIVLSCDEVGNRVTVSWSSTEKTIADLKTEVSGKGWTITNQSQVDDYMKLSSLADSAGAQVCPCMTTVDKTGPDYPFFAREILDDKAWIYDILGTNPESIAYPGGYSDSDIITYIKDVAGLLGGRRATIENTTSYKLASINVYDVAAQNIGSSSYQGTGSESDVRKMARHLYTMAKVHGMGLSFYSHSAGDFTAEQYGWLVDELISLGGNVVTFSEFLDYIRSHHSTGDNITYTYTYPDSLNGQLNADSSFIDAGTDVSLTADYAGNPIYGTPDIGAYEYQPPHTVGTDEIDIGAGVRIYGNGKFRDYGTTSGTTADLTITPQSGNFTSYGSDEVRPQWLDVTNITWTNTGTYHKAWTESSTVSELTNTIHIIGDLEANKYYNVKVDNTLGQNISGDDCAGGVCRANTQGKIIFTYVGTYSEHTFDVEEGDNTAPALSDLTPQGTIYAAGTDSATLSFTTNENAICKYSTTAGTAYGDMTGTFEATGGTTHSFSKTNLQNGNSYRYFVKCQDITGNITASDQELSFSVSPSEYIPVIAVGKSKTYFLSPDVTLALRSKYLVFRGKINSLKNGRVELFQEGGLVGRDKLNKRKRWRIRINEKQKNANHTYQFKYYNAANQNVEISQTFNVIIDRQRPRFIHFPGRINASPGDTIFWQATDNDQIKYYQYTFQGKTYKTNKNQFVLSSGLKTGKTWKLKVKAYDRAENQTARKFKVKIK